MKKYLAYCIVIFSLLVTACSEDKIETYNTSEYIYFRDTSVNYSFAFDPGVSVKKLPIVVKLIGNAVDYDRIMNVYVDSVGVNVQPEDFKIDPGVFRAGQFVDTLWVHVNNKSDKFKNQIGFLRIAINSSDDFLPGPTVNQRFSVYFSDILLQPTWWNKAIEKDYLGTYSEKKYRHFIIATDGISDMSTLGGSEKRAYTLIFKRYIQDNDLKEENGNPMILSIKE